MIHFVPSVTLSARVVAGILGICLFAPCIASSPDEPTSPESTAESSRQGDNVGNSEEPVDFIREIQPILAKRCYACHGPDAPQRQGGGREGLRLDTRQGAFEDLGGYYAIVPGDLEESELIRRIQSDDPDEVMPPRDHRKSLRPARNKN